MVGQAWQPQGRYLLPALAPILYNLSIIGGAWLLAPAYGVFGLVLGVVVGMSGGIDSSVVAALLVRALGPERVIGLFLPERDRLHGRPA